MIMSEQKWCCSNESVYLFWQYHFCSDNINNSNNNYGSKVYRDWLGKKKIELQSKTEIVVTEGDQEGGKIADLVRQIGASTLVVGLHDQSFLHRYVCFFNGLLIF